MNVAAVALIATLAAGARPVPDDRAAPPAATPAERAAARAVLRDELGRILSSRGLSAARVGVLVRSLDTGEEVFARSPDELLNPASNVKLFTAAAVLARLGPQYRFETEFLLAPGPGGARSLYVRGRGDPTIVTERLWAVAGEIADAGVEGVADLVVDDSWFDEQREGPGFDQEAGDRAYLAPSGAVSLNFNTVAVRVAPGTRPGSPARARLDPPSEHLRLENRAVTVAAGGRRHVSVHSRLEGGRQVVTVEGRLPAGGRSQVLWRRVDDPPAYFGATLRRLLELRGVKVTGRVRRGAVPDRATLVALSESEALGDVVRRMEKLSNNFMAEQLLRTLGAEIRGPPGTWPKGVSAVEEYLATLGLPPGSYLMRNGSGLNDANRFSARQTVTLLEAMWRRFPLQAEFVASLPVAARDGTIRWRMEGTAAAGRLRAKTGTLESVASLSGYVETVVGEKLAFAVIANDHAGRAAAVRAIDEVGSALAAGGVAEPPPAVAVGPAHVPDLAPRVAAYYRLGDAGDRRNLPFLRTALRSEANPVLRLAAAEAVYLSDPDGDGARRAFLDTVAADRGSLPALAVAAAGTRPSPAIGSLADLAAEGSPEAIGLLAGVTAAGAPEDLSRAWEEISASAPAETIAVLAAAPDDVRSAVVEALASGLAGTATASHPLLVELRRAAQAPDAPGGVARAVLLRLETGLAAAPAGVPRPSRHGGG